MKSLDKKGIIDSILRGTRMDGRGLLDYRRIEVKEGIFEKAEGSASCSIGDTKVIVGVKIGVDTPYPDTPNEGLLVVDAKLTPFAVPNSHPGHDEESVKLSRIIDRTIRESKAIDLPQLCIIPGKKAYATYIDLYVLNNDGNYIDASMLATLKALLNTKLPGYVIENGEVKLTEEYKPLPVRNYPVSVTLAKIGDKLIVDPTSDEEQALDVMLCFSIDKDGNICSIQKSGGPISVDMLKEASSIAIEKSKDLRRIVLGTCF